MKVGLIRFSDKEAPGYPVNHWTEKCERSRGCLIELLQFAEEPGLSKAPIAFDCLRRNFQNLGDLGDR